jgi:hypothetical protein
MDHVFVKPLSLDLGMKSPLWKSTQAWAPSHHHIFVKVCKGIDVGIYQQVERLPNTGHMGKGHGALFSLVWRRKFLKMKSKMTKVAIATSTTMNPWMGVINLAHIKTIFAMCHKGCFMSQMFWETTSYTQRKRKPFVGANKNYVCKFCFSSGL